MKRSKITVIGALALTIFILVLGYMLLGWLPMFLFCFGFLGGFILWMTVKVNATFKHIRVPYWITLGMFIVHKAEERYMDFFPELSKITGIPVPDTNSVGVYLLYLASSTWLLIPWLVSKKYQFGYYLTWTFFTSMGVIELAHFIFPLFTDESYTYFPGMASVIWLAPAAWWGLYRYTRNYSLSSSHYLKK
jgi:hypothetical protein